MHNGLPLFFLALFCSADKLSSPADPELLTYDEIVQLYQDETPPVSVQEKLTHLLNTPFVRNTASESGVTPMKPLQANLGKILRVVQWNIERGLEFDALRFALSDPRQFNALMEDKGSKAGEDERAKIRQEIDFLRKADVLVLNEVDWGVNRTLFRNVADELARALNMNYAYGVEFVEVDPVTMGINQQVILREVEEAYAEPHDDREAMINRVREVMKPDPSRYKGLHGTAILSRYMLENVRLIPFHVQGHDWYTDEKKNKLALKAEGKVSSAVFKEQLVRQVRRGGRMMLLADISDPELPSGTVTIVATHLEDVAPPKARREQLEEILDAVRKIDHPVVLAGDMNTSTHTGVPISVTRALKERFGSGKWWAEQGATNAIKMATPLGWAYDLSIGLIGFARKIDDPTRLSIPLLGDNPEARFFDTIEHFRFADGAIFDVRGDKDHSANGRSGRFANGNQRSEKGFVATEELARRFGPIGQYKLDWIFVRPANLTKGDSHFYPAFSCNNGRTLRTINHAIPERISDHNPIAVDLPLNDGASARVTPTALSRSSSPEQ
jgi:endonuclease/exonuclease/phosphatase family metal-dependent hydrolase